MTDRFSHRRRHLFFERKLILTVFVFCFWVAPVQGGSWTPLGPTGSYVRVVRIDPTNPNTVYAGLVFDDGHPVGGVFKSPDGGMTWNDANNGLPPNSGIYALTIDPTNPSTLYVGIDNYGWQGGGMYKSTDGGASWTQLSYHPEWGYLSIAVNLNNPATVFAGTDSWGMVMSVDGGNNWSAANNGLPPNVSVNSVVIDPQNTSIIYGGTTGGLFKSSDGGASWTAINNGLPDPAANIGAIAINPAATPSIVYVGLNGYSGMDGGGVFVSADGGGTWTDANNGLPTTAGVHTIAIDPVTPSNMYVGSFGNGAFQSADAGNSWSDFDNADLSDPLVHSIAINPQNPMIIYAGTCNTGAYVMR